MDTITVYADLVTVLSTDHWRGKLKPVTFEGEQVGEPYREYGRDPLRSYAHLTQTRGEIQTLYRTDKGVLLVHVKTWSDWPGDALTATLYRLTDDAHLQPGGRFEGLGRAVGIGRPLTFNQ